MSAKFRHRWLAAFCIACCTTAAAGPKAPTKSLYDRLGGKPGVAALSDAFITELSQDARLAKSPQVRLVKSKVPDAEAKARLTQALCHVAGGPCKATKADLMKGLPPKLELKPQEWFYVAQDANRAMDKRKIGTRERQELLSLLIKGRGD